MCLDVTPVTSYHYVTGHSYYITQTAANRTHYSITNSAQRYPHITPTRLWRITAMQGGIKVTFGRNSPSLGHHLYNWFELNQLILNAVYTDICGQTAGGGAVRAGTTRFSLRGLNISCKTITVCNIYLRLEGFVFIGVSWFVSKQQCAKTTQTIFTKFDGKVAHGPRKKRLDLGGNPDMDSDPGIFWREFTIAVLAIPQW